MHRLWKLSTLSLFVRLLLAAIFLYASIDKVQHPADFAAIVKDYKVLPDSLVNLTAIILPWLELVLGVLLLLGKCQEGTLLLVNLLLVAFLAVLIFNSFRGIDSSCGCFSTQASEPSSMAWYVVRDSCFVLLGMGAAWMHFKTSGAAAKEAG